MKNINNNREYERNYGFWNETEQECLAKSKVAIAGAGGDGFQLGYKLAMMGVRNFSIADPETFEVENSNRVIGATSDNIGVNKAEVFKKMVLNMRPDACVETYQEGVTPYNVKDFMRGSDLVIDESELTHLEIGANIARAARAEKIPNMIVMNLGFAALATSLNHSSGKTFEDVMGIPKGMPLDEIADLDVDFSRVLAYIPKYGDIRTLMSVKEGYSLPSISQGVDVASALGTTEAFLHLTSSVNNHRRQPTWAPKFRYLDAYSCEGGVIRFPRISYYLGAIALAVRCGIGINPLASYTKDDLDRRNK